MRGEGVGEGGTCNIYVFGEGILNIHAQGVTSYDVITSNSPIDPLVDKGGDRETRVGVRQRGEN